MIKQFQLQEGEMKSYKNNYGHPYLELISDLILKLEQLKSKYGDIPVFTYNDEGIGETYISEDIHPERNPEGQLQLIIY